MPFPRRKCSLLLAGLVACTPPWDLFPACDDGTACAPGSTSSGDATTTTSYPTYPTDGIQTVTSVSSGSSSSSSSDSSSATGEDSPPTEPPQILSFEADPPVLFEAGTSLLQLEVTPDVVSVQLKMNKEVLADLKPADFPYTWEAFSAKNNGSPHTFEVRVKNKPGLSDTDDTPLYAQLPASGAQKCMFPAVADMATEPTGSFSAIVYTDDAIVLGGWRDLGAGPRMVVIKLDPDDCTPQVGWPKTIADWTADAGLASKPSAVSALAVDEHGNIAVGGNLIEGAKPQRYTVMLTHYGAVIPDTEVVGQVGEHVSGVAITPEPGSFVVAVGWWVVTENPLSTDGRVWRIHSPELVEEIWLKAPFAESEKPDPLNILSERARGCLLHPDTGILYVVGERDFQDGDVNVFTRTWIARVDPISGALLGTPWTSPGDAYQHDAATSLSMCGDRLIAAGWMQAQPLNLTKPKMLTRYVEIDGTSMEKVPEFVSPTQGFGAACDREGKVVVAGTHMSIDLDAEVFAFSSPNGPRIPYEDHIASNDAAMGMACDARGFCAWPGYRTVDGHPIGIARVHHP